MELVGRWKCGIGKCTISCLILISPPRRSAKNSYRVLDFAKQIQAMNGLRLPLKFSNPKHCSNINLTNRCCIQKTQSKSKRKGKYKLKSSKILPHLGEGEVDRSKGEAKKEG